MAELRSFNLKWQDRARAMGISYWLVLSAGLLVGQVTTLINVVWVFGWHKVDSSTEEVLKRVVQQTVVQECIVSTSTPGPSSNPSELKLSWTLSIEVFFAVGVVLLICVVSISACKWCGLAPWSRAETSSESPVSDRSPVCIQTLARNQLAELRLRRHGADQSNRFGWVWCCRAYCSSWADDFGSCDWWLLHSSHARPGCLLWTNEPIERWPEGIQDPSISQPAASRGCGGWSLWLAGLGCSHFGRHPGSGHFWSCRWESSAWTGWWSSGASSGCSAGRSSCSSVFWAWCTWCTRHFWRCGSVGRNWPWFCVWAEGWWCDSCGNH